MNRHQEVPVGSSNYFNNIDGKSGKKLSLRWFFDNQQMIRVKLLTFTVVSARNFRVNNSTTSLKCNLLTNISPVFWRLSKEGE